MHGKVFTLMLTILLGAISSATAQQAARPPKIGFLFVPSRTTSAGRIDAFRHGLRERGYIEGKNINIEFRFAEGQISRLPTLAAELVSLKPDIIVTSASAATLSAKEATLTIPIVMTVDSDPVGSGHIANLARPGGNITGMSTLAPELSGKRLEILKETIPRLSRVAVLGVSSNPGNSQQLREVELAAQTLKLQPKHFDIRDSTDLEAPFRDASKMHPQAVLTLVASSLNSYRTQIVHLAATNRLPMIFYAAEWVEAGGLMSYGISFVDNFRRAATYVDKILKGAKPADLPVEQPKKFEFIVNLKAAKQIGLTIPPNVLVRADRVIR